MQVAYFVATEADISKAINNRIFLDEADAYSYARFIKASLGLKDKPLEVFRVFIGQDSDEVIGQDVIMPRGEEKKPKRGDN